MTNIVKKVVNKVSEVVEYANVSVQKTQIRNVFNQIFTKLSEELNTPLNTLRIGIEFRNDQVIFYPYIGKDKVYETIEEREAKNIDLDDYVNNSLVNGWGQMISLFIGNLVIPFAKEAQTSKENITILLRPDLIEYKDKIIFKWDMPKDERKKSYPQCNGMPSAMLCKKKDEAKAFDDNITKVRDIDIESEILM